MRYSDQCSTFLSVDEQIENFRRQMYPSATPTSQEIRKSSLARLPVEVKVLILRAIPNLPTLRNFTLACPAFYAVYIDLRHVIPPPLLDSCLAQGLDIAACALLEVSRKKAGDGELRKFITSYEVDRALCIPFRVEDEEDLAQIARDYLMIHDFTSQCVQEAISQRPITGERDTGTWGDFASLSRTEKRRFYRGFYNYEIICRLVRNLAGLAPVTQEDGRTIKSYLRIFEPWEIEEINCARYYVQKRYIEIVKRCSPALGLVFGQTNMIEGRVILSAPCDSYAYRLESEWYREAAEVCVGQGLPFLRKVLNAGSLKNEVSLLRPLLTKPEPPSTFMQRLWLKIYSSDLRCGVDPTRLREMYPSLRYRGELEGPNTALVYAETLAAGLPLQWPQKERQLAWAYVMWDRDRLENWSVLSTGFRYMSDVYGRGGSEKLVLYWSLDRMMGFDDDF